MIKLTDTQVTFAKLKVVATILLSIFGNMAWNAMAMSKTPDDIDWPVHGGSDFEQRFSPLDQIDRNNIKQLGLAWSFEFDSQRGQEATPVVVDGVMYVSTAWSKVYALDASTGDQLWYFDPQVPGSVAFTACCDVVNRGVAVADGLVFMAALDGRLIALDAKTGKQAWSVQTTDPEKPYTITGAPRVFKGKVIIGNGGAEYGVRGYVTTYDAATGKQLWRFYTVPAAPDAPPDNAASDEILKQLALPTWYGEWYQYGGGGTVWDSIVYDPELHQLYIGVGNGSPWNHQVRSDGKGDNLFLTSIIALDPDTGAYRWHYQENPGESWDFTAAQQMILATLSIAGQERKVLMQAPKNGYFYVLDRQTGKLISAENFVPLNWSSGVDMGTGRPIENPKARYVDEPFVMEPNALGAHSWHPMAFNPKTKIVYLPAYRSLFGYGNDPNFKVQPGAWNNAIDQSLLQAPDDPEEARKATENVSGNLLAWDPVKQMEVWAVKHDTVQNGGVLATAGGLVFQGTGAGMFQARNADNGNLMWQFAVSDGIIAGPISYRLGSTQFIAVVAGYGGGLGIGEGVPNPTARPNGRVHVFRLDGKAKLPAITRPQLAPLNPAKEKFSEPAIDEGRLLYTAYCYRCHGAGAMASGVIPDIRRSAAVSDAKLWRAILVDGVLSENGMVSFSPWLSDKEIENIRGYISRKARLAQQASQ